MLSFSKIRKKALKNCAKLGIGLGDSRTKILLNSVKKANASKYARATIFESASELISALNSGEIEGAVRGTLAANTTIANLKKEFKIDNLYRAAFLRIPTSKTKYFFLAPVGVDEVFSGSEKFELILNAYEFFKNINEPLEIGLISGGRPEDLGRHRNIDRTIQTCENLVTMELETCINIKHYGIQIENAIKDCNFIIAPDGISGNLIFRTLYFLGRTQSLGAPSLSLYNKFDKIYIDTSRDKRDYWDSLILASALAF